MFNFGSGIKNLKNDVVEKKDVEEEVRGEMRHGELNFEDGPISFYLDDWKSITEVDGSRDYVEGIGKSLDTTKWGQLKLLMSEIFLMTFYSSPSDVIVYVGAASGEHIYVLAQLFSNKFILYDSRDFDPRLDDLENVEIKKRYFDDNDVLKFSKSRAPGDGNDELDKEKLPSNVIFISDIRNLGYNTGGRTQKEKEENEVFVWQDMQLQERWVREIKPKVAFLKFRLPYAYESEMVKGKMRKYLDGEVIRQVYAGQSSSETRLLVEDPESEKDWDILDYEKKLFYHNTYVRSDGVFLNPLKGKLIPVYEKRGIGNDFDSIFATMVIMKYLQAIGEDVNTKNVVAIFDFIFDNLSVKKIDLLKIKSGKFKTYDD